MSSAVGVIAVHATLVAIIAAVAVAVVMKITFGLSRLQLMHSAVYHMFSVGLAAWRTQQTGLVIVASC